MKDSDLSGGLLERDLPKIRNGHSPCLVGWRAVEKRPWMQSKTARNQWLLHFAEFCLRVCNNLLTTRHDRF